MASDETETLADLLDPVGKIAQRADFPGAIVLVAAPPFRLPPLVGP